MRQVFASATQLLICFEYDIEKLAAEDVPGGLKGVCAASEVTWLLRKR